MSSKAAGWLFQGPPGLDGAPGPDGQKGEKVKPPDVKDIPGYV